MSAGFEFRLIDTVFFFLSMVLLSHSFAYHRVKELFDTTGTFQFLILLSATGFIPNDLLNIKE